MENIDSDKSLIKILLLGGNAVGKTCILHCLKDKHFDCDSTMATIAMDFRIKTFHLKGKTWRVQLWDSPGNGRFNKVTESYISQVDGILLVYDITDLESFKSVLKWLPIIEKKGKKNLKLLVVGNKCDLEKRRRVPMMQVDTVMIKHEINWLEMSAKNQTNVELVFHQLAGDILNGRIEFDG